MRGRVYVHSKWLVLLGATCALVGCQNFSNPFAGPPPAYKTQYGLTPSQRIDRLAALARQMGGTPPAEQRRMSASLTAELAKEQDPLVRRGLVRTLGAITTRDADATLQAALKDPSALVRMAACEAWGRRTGPAAVGALATMLHGDEEVDVRIAASRALGQIPSTEAARVLGTALDANDPAIQLSAMEALRRTTGREFGDDINNWHRYLAGRPTAPAKSGSPIQQASAVMASPPSAAVSR